MSIHVFHSKLMSGIEEGSLFEALRRLRGIEPAQAAGEESAQWNVWTDGATAEGWVVWTEEVGESSSFAQA